MQYNDINLIEKLDANKLINDNSKHYFYINILSYELNIKLLRLIKFLK